MFAVSASTTAGLRAKPPTRKVDLQAALRMPQHDAEMHRGAQAQLVLWRSASVSYHTSPNFLRRVSATPQDLDTTPTQRRNLKTSLEEIQIQNSDNNRT